MVLPSFALVVLAGLVLFTAHSGIFVSVSYHLIKEYQSEQKKGYEAKGGWLVIIHLV